MGAVTGDDAPQRLDDDSPALIMINDLRHSSRLQRPISTACETSDGVGEGGLYAAGDSHGEVVEHREEPRQDRDERDFKRSHDDGDAHDAVEGEDGFEVMLPAAEAEPFWRALDAAGVASCGLGARDTLRLEAGMNLYGNDMDESKNPLESGLAWTVAFDPPERDFVGRRALEALRAEGVPQKLVGLVLEERGVLRSHQKVSVPDLGDGEVTSGTWSPTLERSIAFARVPRATGATVQVEMRGKLLPARVVKLPFVRNGRILIEL